MMIIIVVIEPTTVLKPQRGEMSVENATSPNHKPQRGEMCIVDLGLFPR